MKTEFYRRRFRRKIYCRLRTDRQTDRQTAYRAAEYECVTGSYLYSESTVKKSKLKTNRSK
jgi:hypothetical protein